MKEQKNENILNGLMTKPTKETYYKNQWTTSDARQRAGIDWLKVHSNKTMSNTYRYLVKSTKQDITVSNTCTCSTVHVFTCLVVFTSVLLDGGGIITNGAGSSSSSSLT